MKLLPVHPSLAALLATAEAALPQAAAAPPDGAVPDWRNAYLRQRAQHDEDSDAQPDVLPDVLPDPLPAAPLFAKLTAAAPPDAPVPAATVAPATATTTRIDALRQLAEPAPAAVAGARAWQVELPAAAGPAWQLHIEQAQPAAPLTLVLQVPPAAQAQARQQLGDLERRLREGGHGVLQPRLGDTRKGRHRTPLDEVDT